MNQESKNVKTGGISVDREHIFPIIKKWLYSEKDIFLREIISNAADAVTKLRRLSSLGIRSVEGENYKIDVTLDSDEGTLTVSDNGIGMSEEEVDKYICSIALSGAVDFIQKYEDQSAEGAKNGIIGHFGLGFYSAFMVSDSVEIVTKSYTDAPAVHWSCSESGEYEMSAGERNEHGTDVIMHISENESEYLSKSKIRAILEKYCAFMPVEIYFHDASDENVDSDSTPINDTHPLWQKSTSEATEEDYKNFYSKVFNDYKDPLFHIHINADYPLNFKGILYFPRLSNEYETIEGQVKLYYNQVFVADNIKEVIPEYLMMLKGVLDCPELPLNVSRSYLQTNTYVSKLSAHIVKKLADKLCALCNNERETYENIWQDIAPFIEYASMKDKKFYDRVKGALLLPLIDGTKKTFAEYLEMAKETNENTVYYATDKALQSQYISLFEAQNIKVALLDRPIDLQFVSMLEQYMENVKFLRVDSGIADSLKTEQAPAESESLRNIFAKVAGEKTKIEFSALKDESLPVMLTLSEESRRMEEMMRMYNISSPDLNSQYTLVINSSSPLIRKIEDACENNIEKAKKMASYAYKLSLLSQKKFSPEEMKEFMQEAVELMMQL